MPISVESADLTATGSARIHRAGEEVHLEIDDPEHDSALEVKPREGEWDLSPWSTLAVDVKNLSLNRQMRLVMILSAATDGPKDKQWTVGIALNPHESRTMRMPLPHEWQFKAPDGLPGVKTINTEKIRRIQFLIQWPFESATKGLLDCTVSHLRVEGRLQKVAPLSKAAYLPFIDRYGQFIHADWPSKVHTDADLRANYISESKELKALRRPRGWDQYGGWAAGPQLKATGSFRTERYRGKWYFVDPAGHLFFSQAVDVAGGVNDSLRAGANSTDWFDAPLGEENHYDAVGANLRVKYGRDDYKNDYERNLARRLTAWGFNSLGDWSSADLMSLGAIPYTLQLTDYDDKMPKIGSSKLKFYDVFDPRYINKMKNLLAERAASDPLVRKSLTDPMCIGYFIDNELNFGNRGPLILIAEILKTPSSQAIKQELASDLKLKYATVNRLNAAWHTSYKSWPDFLEATTVPSSDQFSADSEVFFQRVLDQYFKLARDSIKSVAPNRLYLGARFISTDAVRPRLYEACSKYCDVLSVNIYAHSVANFPADHFPDMPVLVTEFQFGELQRGMFSPSLCQAGTTPEDRALAYKRFVQGALVHPNIVGTQWFQYRDQPLTGRGDGENYQIGFVDVTDTPYREMTSTSREIGAAMYRYRQAGKLADSMDGNDK